MKPYEKRALSAGEGVEHTKGRRGHHVFEEQQGTSRKQSVQAEL